MTIPTEAKTDRENKNRRDLELVLLGVVLARHEGKRSEDGQRVLDALPHGSFTKEIDPLIGSVRDTKPEKIIGWLTERNAQPEKGKDAVQSVIDALHSQNETEAICSIARTLSLLPRQNDKEQMKHTLKNALERLEKL